MHQEEWDNLKFSLLWVFGWLALILGIDALASLLLK